MERIFGRKPPERLREQLSEAQKRLGEEIPQPFFGEDIFELSENELRERFPRRFEIYTQLLKESKGGEEIGEEEREDFRRWLTALNSLDLYIANHKTNEDERTLRGKQENVLLGAIRVILRCSISALSDAIGICALSLSSIKSQ